MHFSITFSCSSRSLFSNVSRSWPTKSWSCGEAVSSRWSPPSSSAKVGSLLSADGWNAIASRNFSMVRSRSFVLFSAWGRLSWRCCNIFWISTCGINTGLRHTPDDPSAGTEGGSVYVATTIPTLASVCIAPRAKEAPGSFLASPRSHIFRCSSTWNKIQLCSPKW